ncbi:hypothetical protein HPULCUR_002644 [Helicostylum pulchrum]|uniref:Yeast cell wall synthesis Kre9/Knh1-like N-terminal domain-containing protein n=1 Tax=Helicostylum pulchrum TaxID=562976 RepID=A0ABP9XR60_9FUNG
MVSLKTFLSTSVALIAAFVTVEAAVAPTYPFPGSIQNEGQAYDITWTFDGKNPSAKYRIDFMTGSNDVQSVLSNVATDVDPAALKYTFVTPEVAPHAAVYFFMFTGSDGDVAWATRFGIVGADGKLVAEEKKTQPNGDKIPWGIGKLSGAASGNTTAPATPSAEITTPPVESPVESPVVNEVSPPAASSSSVSVAMVDNAETSANGASMVKPVLTFASAAIAGYLAL